MSPRDHEIINALLQSQFATLTLAIKAAHAVSKINNAEELNLLGSIDEAIGRLQKAIDVNEEMIKELKRA